MKKVLSLTILILAFFALSFLLTKRYFDVKQTTQSKENTVSVVASFYPMYFFAQGIGGSLADVTNLTPAGSEPHDYEPSPQQIAKIEHSKLLILNGGGLEAWSEKIKQNLQGKPVVIITAGDDFKMTANEEGNGQAQDPHIWLSPVLAKTEVQKILAGYVQVDPTHKTQYEQNAQVLTKKLDDLDQLFSSNLKSCKQKDIITSHAAFGYLAQTYGLNQVSISGISPDEEPSPSQLADVTTFVKDHRIKVIFFESLVSPKLSETIAKETGAQTAVLDPLEGLTDEEIQSGSDYFSVMNKNLASLRVALECQ